MESILPINDDDSDNDDDLINDLKKDEELEGDSDTKAVPDTIFDDASIHINAENASALPKRPKKDWVKDYAWDLTSASVDLSEKKMLWDYLSHVIAQWAELKHLKEKIAYGKQGNTIPQYREILLNLDLADLDLIIEQRL
ncbi:hypothetical protein Tco_0878811 [Tanacetum coccineum]|uniref:Uncharacterized protein n=1 Tax=Tanacetum coccineum TaxID=301880 RepID=A0ABQ5BZ96_9ASTR